MEKEFNELKLKTKEYEKDNNSLNKKLKNYENENKKLKNSNKELLDKLNNSRDKINKLYQKNELKDDEIKEWQLKMPYKLKKEEKLMSVIFTFEQKILHSFICKNTDKFNQIENLLYEKYPEFIESDNYFTVNGKIINKYKTIEQNKINDSDIIVLNIR